MGSVTWHLCGVHCTPSITAVDQSDRAVLDEADVLILPGVGRLSGCHGEAASTRPGGIYSRAARGGKPILGICLGMQLMADMSTEHRTTAGIGLIPGEVKRMGEWSLAHRLEQHRVGLR